MALNESDIAHLIRRTEIVASEARIAELAALPSIAAAVDLILAKNTAGNASTPRLAARDFTFESDKSWEVTQDYRRWWIDEMAFGSQPLREKMALFWHGHFTSHSESSGWWSHIYDQINLYRVNAFGNFRQLTKDMSVQPLMLKYLNNDQNWFGEINENFARELLELFTIGLNHYGLISGQQFPYTQEDVKSAAKAWTGENLHWYETKRSEYEFKAGSHVTGTFTFLGETKNFRGFDIIDKVTTADPYKTITARHIATKLWTFFAYPNPDATLIADLVTSTNFANTWNIKDLLRGILVHNSFYSTNAKTGLVSNPAEYSARLLSIFGQRAGGAVVELNKTIIYFDHDTVNAMVDMSQELLNPPNVAGWKNNSYWLSTSQLGARGNLAKRLWGYSVMINKMKDLESLSVDSAVVTAARRLGIVNLQPATKSNIVTWLTVQRARSGSSADFRSQGLLHLLIMSPDFQLS